MNSQTTLDITGFRTYLPDSLRLRFDEQLSVRTIAQQVKTQLFPHSQSLSTN
ncbi:hypothetical protein TUM13735_42090 [Escherichia coli]|nr:hypothetical protein TUM13735_42090 [Escherichia coli]